MTKNLVIVESPAKARTIERYLGPGYKVLASYGHVRDLPENPGKNKLGVDVEHDFKPEYEIAADRKKQVDAIAKEAKGADAVYLATDLDREGEAIAWHVAEAANGRPEDHPPRRPSPRSPPTRSATHSPTRARSTTNLVDAQQTRRILDRLVGYTLSPLLWRKVQSGLSAGRVQSVAVRLVVEREREISAFTAREYWTIGTLLATDRGETFTGELVKIDGETVATAARSREGTAHRRRDDGGRARRRAARASARTVTAISAKQQPTPAGAAVHDIDAAAGGEPQARLQPQADDARRPGSVRGRRPTRRSRRPDHLHAHRFAEMASVAMREARDVITQRAMACGTSWPEGRNYEAQSKGAQEAHEAIRPTSFARDPDSLEHVLDAGAAAPVPADLAACDRLADAGQGARDDHGRPDGRQVRPARERHPDHLRRLRRGLHGGRRRRARRRPRRSCPTLAEGERTNVVDVMPEQHFTQPPPRYTEASLIKALEERGIGRPSTYAATISTITDRGYVTVVERRLRPEHVGEVVTDLLVEHFNEFVDYDFTARMEDDLDQVAEGKRAWVPMLHEFYDPFVKLVEQKRAELKRSDFTTEETDEVCSEGHPMVIRLGRTGRFLRLLQVPRAQGDAAAPR